MANTYSYTGPGTRWAEGNPTAEDYLNIARINCDHLHEALNTLMDTAAADGAVAIAGNIDMADDKWIGLGASGARMQFDDQTPDKVQFLDCVVDIAGDLTLSGGGDGALRFTNAGENSIKVPDNQASALIIEEANNAYLTFVTTNSGEKIVLGKKLEAGSVEIEGTGFDINGGAIDGTAIGAASASTGAFSTITGSGVLSIDDTTASTSGTTGSIHTDGGLGVAKNLQVGTTAWPTSIMGNSAGRMLISAASEGAFLIMHDDTAVAADKGAAGMYFTGRSNDSGPAFGIFAQIRGLKENATQGNVSGFLSFLTATSPSNPAERLRITSLGRVGINETDPAQLLHLTSTTEAGARILLEGPTDGYPVVALNNPQQEWWMLLAGNNTDEFVIYDATNGKYAFQIEPGVASNTLYLAADTTDIGRVGIGTASPDALLEVHEDQCAISHVKINNQTDDNLAGAALTLTANGGSGAIYMLSTTYADLNQYKPDSMLIEAAISCSNGLVLSSAHATADMTFYTNNALRMTIDGATGSVGIGVIDPAERLEVFADSNTTPIGILVTQNGKDDSKIQLLVAGGDTPGNFSMRSGGETGDIGAGNWAVYDEADSAARLVVDGDGRVGINEADPHGSFQLHVAQGTSGHGGVLIEHTHATVPYGMVVDFTGGAPNSNTHFFFKGNDTSAPRIYIYSTGDLQNVNNSYGGISDERLKSNVAYQTPEVRSYWDDWRAVKFAKFELNSDIAQYGAGVNGTRFGVIAQDMQGDWPGLVKAGFDETAGEDRLGFNYSTFNTIGAYVLQEALGRIEQLEAEITALKEAA